MMALHHSKPRRDYSGGIYPQKAIIRVRASYEVVDVSQRVDAQHVHLMSDVQESLADNTLGQAKAKLHACMAGYRRAQLLATLEAQNTQETPLPETNGDVMERMAALANVYSSQAEQLYVTAANDLHGDDYSRWHAHREALKQVAFDLRVVSRKGREDVASSLCNIQAAYAADIRRCEKALATHTGAGGVHAKREVLLRVNRDIDGLLLLLQTQHDEEVGQV